MVESYLSERAFALSSEWYSDVRFVIYAVPPDAGNAAVIPLEARFGESIHLTGYALNAPGPLRPGEALTLTLFWQTDAPISERYKVFVHLVDTAGSITAQHDSEPVGDLRPTDTWQPGERVADNHGLLVPLDAAPGEYQLRVGLYPVDDPTARLPVEADGESARDFLVVADVEVAQ